MIAQFICLSVVEMLSLNLTSLLLGNHSRTCLLSSLLTVVPSCILIFELKSLPWILFSVILSVCIWIASQLIFHRRLIEILVSYLMAEMLAVSVFPLSFVISEWFQSSNYWNSLAYGCLVLYAAFCLYFFSKWNEQKEISWFSSNFDKNKIFTFVSLAVTFTADILLLSLVINASIAGRFVLFLLLSAVITLGHFLLHFFFFDSDLRRSQAEMIRWQSESKDYMNLIRSQRHDYNLHIHALSGLIDQSRFEEARQYMDKAKNDAADVNEIMPINDAVIGSMLYRYREEARSIGTEIYYHITYDLQDTVCNGFECNKIIGNLLQNALDAMTTEKAKKEGIRVDILRRRGNSVVSVENYFSGKKEDITKVFEIGYSTKQKHDGIGLPMVQKIVNGYGGRIYPEFENDKIRFIVNIPNRFQLEGDE